MKRLRAMGAELALKVASVLADVEGASAARCECGAWLREACATCTRCGATPPRWEDPGVRARRWPRCSCCSEPMDASRLTACVHCAAALEQRAVWEALARLVGAHGEALETTGEPGGNSSEPGQSVRTAEQPAGELDLEELERVARAAARHDEGWTLETAETSPHLAEDPVSSVHLPLEQRWAGRVVTTKAPMPVATVGGDVAAVPDRTRFLLAFQPRTVLALLAELRKVRQAD